MRIIATFVLVLLAQHNGAHGYVPTMNGATNKNFVADKNPLFCSSSRQRMLLSTKLFGNKKRQPRPIPVTKRISYGEESRRYRRTVYSHDDWVKHRASDRFVRNVITFLQFQSGIYRNLAWDILTVTAVSAFIVFWNALAGTFVGLKGAKHAGPLAGFLPRLSLPMAPFSLSSGSLGLLLVFRTNTGYQRWDEARKNWGMNINRTRDLVRMATAWYDDRGVSPERRRADLSALALATWSFVRAMKRHLTPDDEDEESFRKELYQKLPKAQAQAIIDAAHRPNRALFDLSVAIENLPMHWLRKNEIHKAVTNFEDNLGSSERLLTSPVPLFYSRHTARFLYFYILSLPFALYSAFDGFWNNAALIPTVAFLATFLFGIDELANQMEEPFTILPMQVFCDKIYKWCNEIVSWRAGDNGMSVHEPKARHDIVSFDDIVDQKANGGRRAFDSRNE